MNTPIYIDANASAPILPEAKEGLIKALNVEANPSSPHVLGRRSRKLLDAYRQEVANALGAGEKEVYFTSGASEANRWLVDAIISGGRQRGRPYSVVASPFEHPSIYKPLKLAAQNGEIILKFLKSDAAANIDYSSVATAEVVFCTAAHNETGVIPKWEAIVNLAPDSAILIADSAQSMPRMPPLPERVDAIVASAHKLGALPGVGAMVLRGNAKSLPGPWTGGGQESGLRPGTEAHQLIAAFASVASIVSTIRDANQQLGMLRDKLEQYVLKNIEGTEVIAADQVRLSNTSAIVFNRCDGEALRIKLDSAGLCVGFGSACSALAPEPSPSLLAMGYTPEQAKATVRFSLPVGFRERDLQEVISRISKLAF